MLSHTSWGYDRLVWSSDGMMITRQTPINSKNSPLQCHFAGHESHLTSPTSVRGEKPASSRVSCGTALKQIVENHK
jgi:hypothetical protein